MSDVVKKHHKTLDALEHSKKSLETQQQNLERGALMMSLRKGDADGAKMAVAMAKETEIQKQRVESQMNAVKRKVRKSICEEVIKAKEDQSKSSPAPVESMRVPTRAST